MLVLGIESSCDETAAAVVSHENGRSHILSEEISSQIKIHEAYGGVVPEIASREHLANLPLVVSTVLKGANLSLSDISAIAVTRGPGLKGCLLMGCSYAKALAWASGIPLVGVNHIEAHLHAAMLSHSELQYPFLALIVSGGHTEIVVAEALGKYRVIARTSDDAAGEAFDKSANLMGIPYPGGAKLAALADEWGRSDFKLPRVMREAEGFSFSGLKTAIALLIARNREAIATDEIRGSIAYAAQEAIVDTLIHKLKIAVNETSIQSLTISGGVSANKYLRARVSAIKGTKSYFPEMRHCMDNGAMIALVGAMRLARGQKDTLDMTATSSWPIETLS